MKTNKNYTEIGRLSLLLSAANIPYNTRLIWDGWQIRYPSGGVMQRASVIQHSGSYGANDNKLEIMGLLTEEEQDGDSVVGYLTAEEVFERIYRNWELIGGL